HRIEGALHQTLAVRLPGRGKRICAMRPGSSRLQAKPSHWIEPGRRTRREGPAGPARRWVRANGRWRAIQPRPPGRPVHRPASAPSPGGGAMFRVSHRGEGIDDADTIEGARGIVRGQSPGRYEVDEIRPNLLGRILLARTGRKTRSLLVSHEFPNRVQ